MATELTKEKALWMYERMSLIRNLEERVIEGCMSQKIPGFAHSYAGEEAIAVGTCAQLTDRDFITSTHRGHGHCIAKGVDVKQMVAELYGKATGLGKGKGGSMHIADIEKGMLGANGIVGAGGPIACGSALSAKVRGTDQVTICFFGDGAANQGTMHESMNLAAILKLPLVFVCEHNIYGEATPASYACAVEDICSRAVAYAMPGIKVDGTDAVAVYEVVGEAVARARSGKGPTLIEAKAFRYYGHYVGDPQTYQSKEEIEGYKAKDPIMKFKKYILQKQFVSEAELDALYAKAGSVVQEAVKEADAAPWPAVDELLKDVYSVYSAQRR
jgi:acetoin:2,6-dichlorophenolindophenol oxidoreductase subunit alpha